MTAIAVTQLVVNCVQLVALTWIAAWQQRAAMLVRSDGRRD